MRLLVLFFLAAHVWAAPKAWHKFEQSAANTLSQAQTATYSGVANYVTYAADTHAGGAYGLAVTNGAYADFSLDYINTGEGQVEFAWKTGSDVSTLQTLWWGGGNGAGSNRVIEHHISSGAFLMVVNNAAACSGVTPSVSANEVRYDMIRWSSTKTEFWTSTYNLTTGAATNKVLVCTGAAPAWGTKVANRHGNGFNDLDKWLGQGADSFIFLDQWNENWPTVINLKKGKLWPKIFTKPRLKPRPGLLSLLLLPSLAQAKGSDRAAANRARESVESQRVRTLRVSPTRTPARTPTPAVSATPTPTPARR